MSDNSASYNANYQGYQDWSADKSTQYTNILNDTEMSENDPIEWVLSLLGCIMSDEYGSTGWVGEAIGHAADDTTTIANLQSLFSNPSAYDSTPEGIQQEEQILDQTDELYTQAGNDTDPSNPFYDTDKETQSQLEAIMPPGWDFSNDNVNADQCDAVNTYFNSEWSMAAAGNTSSLTATQTAFNTENTNLTGTSQNLQSQETYLTNELEQIEGLFKNTTQAVSGVTSSSVRNEIPS